VHVTKLSLTVRTAHLAVSQAVANVFVLKQAIHPASRAGQGAQVPQHVLIRKSRWQLRLPPLSPLHGGQNTQRTASGKLDKERFEAEP
jgi:hypothetical protein